MPNKTEECKEPQFQLKVTPFTSAIVVAWKIPNMGAREGLMWGEGKHWDTYEKF